MKNMQMIDAASALGFVEAQRVHIETEVNKTTFPEIQYAALIPVDTTANPFTRTVRYYSTEEYGKADWINGNADDIPLAGNTVTKNDVPVHMAGIGYGYGWDELQESIAYGLNLPNDDAVAARNAYERFVDGAALFGDTEKGMSGLLNNGAVTIASPVTGDWLNANTTPMQILADVNALLGGVNLATGQAYPADTLLLPLAQYQKLASTPMSDKSDLTILEFIKRNNVYTAMTGNTLTIRAVTKLADAGGSNSDRAVAYHRNPRVLKLHIPMPHRFLPVFQTGALNFVVPGVFRFGGVNIREKDGVRYMDGI